MVQVTSAEVQAAAAALAAGRIVGMPTDTVYGLAVDPRHPGAGDALFRVKGRERDKPIGLLAAEVEQALELVEVSPAGAELARRHWPGALTVVGRSRIPLPPGVGDPEGGTVGVRVPAAEATLRLLAVTGPLAVTSANRSGHPPALDHLEARAVFGKVVALYLPGRCPGGSASTVIDASSPALRVLRPGPISVD